MRPTSSALSSTIMLACIATSFAGNDRKDFCGIGVKFGLKGGAVIIEEVYPGWGADKARLPVGSKAVSIDGKVTKGMAVQDVFDLILGGGGEGDIVSITVLQDSGQRKTYEITRTLPPPSDEVTFRTAAKAPAGFDSWTFFWSVPEIAPDASLAYRVIQPDGKTYMSYGPIKGPPGQLQKSDFSKGFAGGDPIVFFNQDIVVKIMVDKGKMKFDPEANYRFQFHNTVKAIKEQTTETGAAERLKQTKQLFNQGLISKEDYDNKVKEIMDAL